MQALLSSAKGHTQISKVSIFHFKESLFIRESNNVLIHMLHKVREGEEAGPCAIIGYPPPPPDPEMRNGHNCARTRRKEGRWAAAVGQQK